MPRYVYFLIVATLFLAGAMPVVQAQVLSDPNILMPEFPSDWKTLDTPHFRIHHEAKHKEYAQKMATMAERVHDKLTPWLGWQPKEPTEVVLLDTIDTSNGRATPLPFNLITMYMFPPVDGELMDQSPWIEMVFTHEYVHILHLDMADGFPMALRNILGRSTNFFTLFEFPQLFSPTWVVEGIAVYGESTLAGEHGNATQYGRLNSAFYEAMMRMEVKRGLRSLTEVSFNSRHRWPYGIVYLYGAYFFKFVEANYGREAVSNYIRIYGSNIIPFRMDKRSKQIFKKPANEVWAEFQHYLIQRFVPQLAAIKQQHRILTAPVYTAPFNNTELTAASNGDVYFLHDDESSSTQVRRIAADGSNQFIVDGRGVQDIDWHDEAGLLLSKFAFCDNTNLYADLYRWTPGMASPTRLTRCGRYVFAAWRPDGKAIAAIRSELGLSHLVLLDSEGKFISMLAELPLGDTLGHIDWSPDGASIVASIKRSKSGWNLEKLDVSTRQWQSLTSGRDLVQRPRFSADGKEVYFLSDHDKVWNLRRLNLLSHQVDTISSTESAITDAVQMSDKSYRLVEYTPYGQSIVALQASDAPDMQSYKALPDAMANVDAIINAADYQAYPYTAVRDYSPWQTLKPYSWFPLLGSGGDELSYAGTKISGKDALDFHSWSATPLYYYNLKQLGGFANYSFYNKVTLSAQRDFSVLGIPGSAVRYREEKRNYQALLHHSFNTFDSNLYLAAGMARELIDARLYSGIGVDQHFQNTITGAIAQFDSSRVYKRSISPVDGRRVQLLNESYDALGGSDYSGKTVRMDWHEYLALGNNHALHFRLLHGVGDAGIRSYRLGGVDETLSLIGGNTGLGRRDFPLRGYPVGLATLNGNNISLFTAEWKFPLGYHYDGWFVPPWGIGRESLTLFTDSGDAWKQGEAIEFKTGVGVEWNVESLLGYDLLRLTTTLGYAQGLAKEGESRVYFRINLPLF